MRLGDIVSVISSDIFSIKLLIENFIMISNQASFTVSVSESLWKSKIHLKWTILFFEKTLKMKKKILKYKNFESF